MSEKGESKARLCSFFLSRLPLPPSCLLNNNRKMRVAFSFSILARLACFYWTHIFTFSQYDFLTVNLIINCLYVYVSSFTCWFIFRYYLELVCEAFGCFGRVDIICRFQQMCKGRIEEESTAVILIQHLKRVWLMTVCSGIRHHTT